MRDRRGDRHAAVAHWVRSYRERIRSSLWPLTFSPLCREQAGGGIARRVAGMDAGQGIVRAGCPVDPPRLPSAPPQGRDIGVAFLLVTSLWPHKEK